MKILYLKLKNFAHIYSGLQKDTIELDFSDSHKVINVIIGKMGSCKTVILGHLQPFASFGSLDSRNQDDIVISGKNGLKEIHIQNGPDLYKILHEYHWSKDHHVLKSFLTKNETEMNPSGSVTAFKTLIEIELGIDPGMLTLLRLGPNVTNLIDLKATSRKSFMASLLQETEIYTMLYKKLNDDLRGMTTQIQILGNRLAKVSDGNIEAVKRQHSAMVASIRDTEHRLDQAKQRAAELQAEIRTLVPNGDVEAFDKKRAQIEHDSQSLRKDIDDLRIQIQSTEQLPGVTELIKEIGSLSGSIGNYEQSKLQLNRQIEMGRAECDSLKIQLLRSQDAKQLDQLKEQFNEVCRRYDEAVRLSSSAPYQYDSITLTDALNQIQNVSLLINDIATYNNISVHDILVHGQNAVSIANKRLNILNATKAKLQKKLNNVRYLEQYSPTDLVFTPPFCPTEDCPWRITHPVTVQSKLQGGKIDEEYEKIKKDCEDIDIEIGRLSEYTLIFSKVNALRNIWNVIAPVLNSIGALRVMKVIDVFETLSSQIWYDHDKVINAIEVAKAKELADRIQLKMDGMKAQIQALENADAGKLQEQYDAIQAEIQDLIKDLEVNEKLRREALEKQEKLNQQLEAKMQEAKHKFALKQKQEELCRLDDEVDHMRGAIIQIEDKEKDLSQIETTIRTFQFDLDDARKKLDNIKLSISEYDTTSSEIRQIQKSQAILKLIVEAVSSSKGIPLVYIQLFLRTCRSTLNELISDVFGDQIEVLDFIITESEFRIPYSINGTEVDDIAKASQGQRSIISLALSFALMRQATSRYNIMLLDEMDGPLYTADRSKFIDILYKQIQAIDAEQIFLVSHNNTFEGHSVNVIMTTEEHVEDNGMITVMHV